MTMHQPLAFATKPSERSLIPVENMMRIVHRVGLETMLSELAEVVEGNFRR